MKIIRESETLHWAIGKNVRCDRCDTIFQLEDQNDFSSYSYTEARVKVCCPRCKHYQDAEKPKRTKNDQGTITFSNAADFDNLFNEFDKLFATTFDSKRKV
jgi:phage FluMu protein Com